MKPKLPGQGLARLQARFRALAPREQKLVLAMSAVVGLGLFFACLSWQIKENARLDKALPLARAQLARMQDAAAEITRLKAAPQAPQTTGKALIDVLQATAHAHKLDIEIHRVEEGLVQISGSGLDFDALTIWLGQTHREQGLSLIQGKITREAQGGVHIDAQLSASH